MDQSVYFYEEAVLLMESSFHFQWQRPSLPWLCDRMWFGGTPVRRGGNAKEGARAAHCWGAWASLSLRLTAEPGGWVQSWVRESGESEKILMEPEKWPHPNPLQLLTVCVHVRMSTCPPIKGTKLINAFQRTSIWLPIDRNATASLPPFSTQEQDWT